MKKTKNNKKQSGPKLNKNKNKESGPKDRISTERESNIENRNEDIHISLEKVEEEKKLIAQLERERSIARFNVRQAELNKAKKKRSK